MIDITKITGRLGNQMFWYAFAYNYAREHGITDSYFPQNMEWFAESSEEIKKIFGQGIGFVDKVGIHVRRTDYGDENRIQYILPMSYYKKAMEFFPDKKFIVCSDDIKWCMKQEIFKDCEFSEGNEIDDMNLLASCNGLITANSSFSFWAGYLNNNKGIIVAPEKWDKEGKVFSFPDNWEII